MIALDLRNEANTLTLLADALTPAATATYDDLTEFFERYADTDENGHSWIRVDTLADLILDNQDLAALIRPATSPQKGIAPAATGAIQKEGRQADAQLN